MFQTALDPIAVITTMQPMLVLWLMAIAFFVSLAIVAWVSEGKSWVILVNLFAAIFVATWLLSIGAVTWLTPIDVVDIQVVSTADRK